MAWHLDFGDDGYVARCGVGDHLTNLLLRIIIRSVRGVVVGGRVEAVADEGLFAFRSPLREFGVAFDLDAPTLIVREMPMKSVELVGGQDIDIAFDLLDRKEVAHHVEVCAAIAEIRGILNRAAGDRVAVLHQELTKRLQGIIDASRRASLDANVARGDLHAVALRV